MYHLSNFLIVRFAIFLFNFDKIARVTFIKEESECRGVLFSLKPIIYERKRIDESNTKRYMYLKNCMIKRIYNLDVMYNDD